MMNCRLPYVNNYINSVEMQKEYQKSQINKKSNGLGFYILFYFLSMNIIVIGVMFALAIFRPDLLETFDFNSTPMYLMQILASVFAAFIPALFYFMISNSSISETIQVKFVKPGILIPIVLFAMAVCMLANVAAELVSENFAIFGLENTLNMENSATSLFNNILYVISTAIVPAFAEEFAFRGVVLGSLRKYGDSLAIIASAVMFGAMHGNIIQIPFAFILGLLFGFVTCKTNSIVPAICIHFINNFYSVIFDIFQTNKVFSEDVFYIVYLSVVLFFCISGCLSLIYMMKKDKNFFKISDKSSDNSSINMYASDVLTLKEKVKQFFLNAGVILCLNIFAVETVMFLGLVNV